ncbi:MAG: pilus assembly FimT family protein [Thermosulfidibacteraceae bacterium]|jgi:Tfp pilus assembly protein FimT
MRKGFTLIELVVILGIVAIVILISVPRFARIYRSYKFDHYASSVEAFMKRAKMLAMESGNNTAICLDGRTLLIKNAGTSRSSFCSGTSIIDTLPFMDSFISVEINKGFFDGLAFDPRGLAINSGSVVIRNNIEGTCVKFTTQSLRGVVRREGC